LIARMRATVGRKRPKQGAALTPAAGRHTLAGVDALKLMAALNPRGTDDDETVLHRLPPFLIAGLKGRFPISSSVTAKTPHGFAYGRSRKCS